MRSRIFCGDNSRLKFYKITNLRTETWRIVKDKYITREFSVYNTLVKEPVIKVETLDELHPWKLD